ncbi:MAG TPA: PDDEXK nuclease domain-containing protein [Lentisphaeria bacterium]|nr:PDDEXK nuclease domain-containing protein [Lentisphaeria bacterium]
MSNENRFESLVLSIREVHNLVMAQVGRAVNIGLTLRNWLIGQRIRDYEQGGAERAEYGAELCDRLATRLASELDRCYTGRYLRLCRQFYSLYPHIRKSLISESRLPAFWKSLISESDQPVDNAVPTVPSLSAERLVTSLSFTHFIELMKCEDPLKRAFYEIECVRGGWSVRELKRQIATLYFERSALSRDKAKLAELAQATAEKAEPRLAIRDPYVFEFLGLKPHEVLRESDVEEALLDRLQAFLLELGHGFCFEARQKRILIGDTHGFIDLVFYHRILKCHVLIELKVDAFSHEHLGQLNTYVSWYRANIMAQGDNPPIGLLLCTAKDQILVEYALAGLDNRLFVSKYQLELPSREKLTRFLEQQRREVEG